MACCPYYSESVGCTIAAQLRLCVQANGFCVVNKERCCGVVELVDGARVRLWQTCRFYMHAADCRYCAHYDANRSWCRAFNRPVKWFAGTCPRYEGPRPVPSLAVRRA